MTDRPGFDIGFEHLETAGLPAERSCGGKTKYRVRLDIVTRHALDGACVEGFVALSRWKKSVLQMLCTGRDAYRRTRLNRGGFVRGHLMRRKQVHGFAIGDIVKAVVPSGGHTGVHPGCVGVRSGHFASQFGCNCALFCFFCRDAFDAGINALYFSLLLKKNA